MPEGQFGRQSTNSAVACAIAAARSILACQSWIEQMTQEERAVVTRKLGERSETYARTLWLNECCKAERKD